MIMNCMKRGLLLLTLACVAGLSGCASLAGGPPGYGYNMGYGGYGYTNAYLYGGSLYGLYGGYGMFYPPYYVEPVPVYPPGGLPPSGGPPPPGPGGAPPPPPPPHPMPPPHFPRPPQPPRMPVCPGGRYTVCP